MDVSKVVFHPLLITQLNFRLLEVRGDQLTHLEMRNIDELNLNAILLVRQLKANSFCCKETNIITNEIV